MPIRLFLRGVWTASLLLIGLVQLMGCVPNSTVVTERRIDQMALVPSPSGPHAVGPMIERGAAALEAGVSFSSADPAEHSRYDGQPGHAVLNTLADVRLAYGITDRFEMGFDLEYGSGGWSTAVPNDVSVSLLEDESFWRGGVQVRGLLAGSNELGVGSNLEVSWGGVPYQRAVYETQSTYQYDSENNDPLTPLNPELVDTRHERFVRNERETIWFWRAGLFGVVSPIDLLTLTGGVMLQSHPLFFGSMRADGVCDYYDGFRSCEGYVTADQVDPSETESVSTGFLTASLNLGSMTLTGQFYGHFSGHPRIVNVSPFGGEVSARINF